MSTHPVMAPQGRTACNRLNPCEKNSWIRYQSPQHGRILYGSMDREELVIRKSHIYDFTEEDTGLVDFFARMLLSCSVEEPLQRL